jgi:hypothetical protein
MQRKEGIVKKVAALALSLLGSALVLDAFPAAATDVSLESRTYLPARGTDGENTHVLLYEYLTLDATDLVQPGLYLRAAGWGRADLADETFGRKSNSELQYAYLGWRAPILNAEARVGRLSLTAGVARHEVFDGLMFGSDLGAGFDATLFGGIPIEVGEESRSEDLLYGIRISQGRAGLYRLGVSYLKERNGGDDVREEAGSDLFFAPLPQLQLTGTSLYNVADEQWARHDYRLVLGPFVKVVRLTATWASTDYVAYFVEPMNHALLPIEDEKHDRFGGEIEILLGRGFSVAGEYVTFSAGEGESGEGDIVGARLDWAGTGSTAGAGYRRVHGEALEDRYQRIDAHATTAFGPVHVAVGADHLTYEVEINGEKTATTATLGVGYDASRSLEVSASLEYGKTPEFDREIKGLLAVLWRYDASFKKGGTK